MGMRAGEFVEFFGKATEDHLPYDFQERLAQEPIANRLIQIPTGLGKTSAVVLGWLWQRRVAPRTTPTRLVYCLPMRVLVEQTRGLAREWTRRVDPEVAVYTLMGGEVEEQWELYPELPAILVGTQDMMLSRALNRGYAMSPFKWPVHYGLLNNDSLWVCDEVQLMGSGLETTAQLAAWRHNWGVYGPTATWWMSATLDREWLGTVDFSRHAEGLDSTQLEAKDLADDAVKVLLQGSKPLRRLENSKEKNLAREILDAHQSGSLTISISNTVDRAVAIYTELKKLTGKKNVRKPELILLHSRFRPLEREAIIQRLHQEVSEGDGRIIITTQVIEAGVDLSARTLFTDLAPWASMVQRFGRCNRRGEYGQELPACVRWFDLKDSQAKPYEAEELAESRERLRALDNASIETLSRLKTASREKAAFVLRRKDLVELFDTTPDLSGAEIDVSRYVRETDDLDIGVYWRSFHKAEKPPKESRPRRDELCAIPFYQLREFLGGEKMVWRWDALAGEWHRVSAGNVLPGNRYLMPSEFGGYSVEFGWAPGEEESVPEVPCEHEEEEAYDSDKGSSGVWLTIAEHTDGVVAEASEIAKRTNVSGMHLKALGLAARWHDRGKGHFVFQGALPKEELRPGEIWAKAPGRFSRYERPRFRHELASALAVLQSEDFINDQLRDLVAYLVASHHGKVRLSIRSMPNERVPEDGRRFARGIWEGDVLPALALGDGVVAPEVRLSLEPMQLGSDADGRRSWVDRMLRMRESPDLGTMRLAYLESLLRAADRRASRKEVQDG